jgi:hypothetical protein
VNQARDCHFRNAVGKFKSRWFGWSALLCGVLLTSYAFSSPYAFHPFCTYDLTYRLQATLEAAGKQYSSEVVRQRSRPRDWIAGLFSSDCKPTLGTALAFRLEDNRIVLLSSSICQGAERKFADRSKRSYADDAVRAMKEHRKVDVASLCTGIMRERGRSKTTVLKYDGFLVDNADKPTGWSGFRLDAAAASSDAQFRIVTATAEAADISPKDDLDTIAPGILKTNFKYREWSDSPERILSFSRRVSQFTYVAYEH